MNTYVVSLLFSLSTDLSLKYYVESSEKKSNCIKNIYNDILVKLTLSFSLGQFYVTMIQA